ncbi:MAG TPA: prepilin-type N-terminal cleavage/methylation domain-containing protein [Lysobacter sp.]
MSYFKGRAGHSRRSVRGVTLVELMVAMLIGLLVTVGAVGIFMTNRKSYAATESLGRVQEGARMAFELMARDIRDSDGTPCAQPGPAVAGQAPMLPMANVVVGTAWWNNWGDGLVGYDNGGLAGTVAGTDAIELHSASDDVITVNTYTANTFTLSRAATDFAADDVVVACDNTQAAVFRIAAPSGNDIEVSNNTAKNCSQNLGVGPSCGAFGYAYATAAKPAMVAKLNAVRWYVKANGRGGNSLYRTVLDQESEILEGVSTPAAGAGGLQLSYLVEGATSYATSAVITAASNWKRVKAVRIELEFEGQQDSDADRIKAGTDGRGLRRSIRHVVSLRNRTS